MPLSALLAMLGVLLFASVVSAVPLSYYSCEIAQEKLAKAHTALKTAQDELLAVQRDEEFVCAELWTCLPGRTFSLDRARRCRQARGDLPNAIKHTIAATHRVQEHQQAASDRHVWQLKVCGITP